MSEEGLAAPRIGVFGRFDSGAFGDIVLGLIIEHELRLRLPSASLSFFAPLGWQSEVSTRGGVIAERFDAWSAARDSFDLVVAAGDVEIDAPVRIGLESVTLVPRLFSREVLDRRLRHLRACGCYPAYGSPLVVDGGATIEPTAAYDVVLLARSRDEQSIARANRLEQKTYVLGVDATVEDIAAAIANARGFAGSSPDFALTAVAFGIPTDGPPAREPSRIDEELDRAAAYALRAFAERKGVDVVDLQQREIASMIARDRALRHTHQILRERAGLERTLFAEAVNRLSEGGIDAATLVGDAAYFHRQWADARHALALAAQRVDEAEQRAAAIETRFEDLARESTRVREERGQLRRELQESHENERRNAEELGMALQELEVRRAQQEGYERLLGTKLVRAALTAQRWFARVRGR